MQVARLAGMATSLKLTVGERYSIITLVCEAHRPVRARARVFTLIILALHHPVFIPYILLVRPFLSALMPMLRLNWFSDISRSSRRISYSRESALDIGLAALSSRLASLPSAWLLSRLGKSSPSAVSYSGSSKLASFRKVATLPSSGLADLLYCRATTGPAPFSSPAGTLATRLPLAWLCSI